MKLVVQVKSIKSIAEDIFEATFYIQNRQFIFKAGQYVTITLPELKNMELREQFRDFSIASSPNKLPLLSIIFRKSESAFKKSLLGMTQGDEVIIEGPSGVFTLQEDVKRPLIFIAGGVGVAPLFSIINFVVEANLAYKITLVYCNRNIESSAYLSELESLARQKPTLRLVNVFGPLEEKNIADMINSNSLWYIAGPPGMAKTARDILIKSDIIDSDIRTEEFTGY